MGQVNEAEAQQSVRQYIYHWASHVGVVLPDFKHLLEADNIRSRMSQLKLGYMALQEGYGDELIIQDGIDRSQGHLALELSRHFRILLEPLGDLDVDDIRDGDQVLNVWMEPHECYGGDPDLGLIFD